MLIHRAASAKGESGFTLIDLLFTASLICTLCTMALPSLMRARGVALLADAQARAAAARERVIEQTAPRTGAALLSEQAWLERVQRSQEQAALELDRRSAELEQRRVALTSAGQRRQVLERLKDRKRQAHHAETNRRDAVALDEIAMTGHVRRLAA